MILHKILGLCEHEWVFNSRPFLDRGGCTKTVELRCLKCGKIIYKDLFSKFVHNVKGGYIFCIVCDNEMLNKEECLISHHDNLYKLKCNVCGYESMWDVSEEVPVRLDK